MNLTAVAHLLGPNLERIIKEEPRINKCIATALKEGQINKTGTYISEDGRIFMYAVGWDSERVNHRSNGGGECDSDRKILPKEGNAYLLGCTTVEMVLEDLKAHELFERRIWSQFLRDGGTL